MITLSIHFIFRFAYAAQYAWDISLSIVYSLQKEVCHEFENIMYRFSRCSTHPGLHNVLYAMVRFGLYKTLCI